MIGPRTVSSLPAALLGAAMLASGCANLEWQFPPPVQDPSQDPVPAARVLAQDAPADAAALLRAAIAEKRAPADELLFELGLVLMAPGLDDRAGARAAFHQLVTQHPDSPYRASAKAIRDLIDQAKGLEENNAALRNDLKRMMDIDLETQRQRRGG